MYYAMLQTRRLKKSRRTNRLSALNTEVLLMQSPEFMEKVESLGDLISAVLKDSGTVAEKNKEE